MEPAHSETGDCRVEPPATILVARLSMSHLVPLLEFNHFTRMMRLGQYCPIEHERLTENRRYFWPGERIPRVYRWLRLCKDSWSLTQTRPAISKTKSRSLTGNDHAQVPHSLELG